MNTHLNARSCDETTPGDIESGKTHEKQQQVQPAELITRTNHIMWSSKMPELISNNKVAPILISHPSSNPDPDSSLHKSFLHSLSEKMQEVFQDMKLVPLLKEDLMRRLLSQICVVSYQKIIITNKKMLS